LIVAGDAAIIARDGVYSSDDVTRGHRTAQFVSTHNISLLAAFVCLLNLQPWCAGAQSNVDAQLKDEVAQFETFEATLKQQPKEHLAREREVKTAIDAALKARNAHRDDEALSFLLRAKYWVPDDPDLLLDTGIQEESMQLYKDADATLAEAQRIRPGDLKTLYAIARVKMDLGQSQASEDAWKSYLDQRPEDASAHYGYGVLLQMLQRSKEAREQFRKSVDLSPRQVESYYRLGELARDDGDLSQAKNYYEQTLAHGPSHAGALTGMAILAYQAHQYSEAEVYLEKAIAAAPDFQTARYYHGLTLAKLGNKEESQSELDMAVQMTNEENARKNQMKQLSAQPYQPK
jgi:tetratricopeptide (TPR) repeat protein